MIGKRMRMVLQAQRRRDRVTSSMVRGMRIRTAEKRSATYERLYREAEKSNLECLKTLEAINRMSEI